MGTAVSISVVDSAPTLTRAAGTSIPWGSREPGDRSFQQRDLPAEETETDGRSDWQHIQHWLGDLAHRSPRALASRHRPTARQQQQVYHIPAKQQRPAVTLFDGRCTSSRWPRRRLRAVPRLSGRPTRVRQGRLQSYQVPTQGRVPYGRQMAPWSRRRETSTWQPATGAPITLPNLTKGTRSSSSRRRWHAWSLGAEQLGAAERRGLGLGIGRPHSSAGYLAAFRCRQTGTKRGYGYLMSEGHLGGIGKGAFTGKVCTSGGVFGADASDVLGSGKNSRVLYMPLAEAGPWRSRSTRRRCRSRGCGLLRVLPMGLRSSQQGWYGRSTGTTGSFTA